jgi:hypothetical protein
MPPATDLLPWCRAFQHKGTNISDIISSHGDLLPWCRAFPHEHERRHRAVCAEIWDVCSCGVMHDGVVCEAGCMGW